MNKCKNHSHLVKTLLSAVALLFFSTLCLSFIAQTGISTGIAVTDSIPGAYGAILIDANNNIILHAHTIKYITDPEKTHLDLSKIILIVNDERTDNSTLQQQDLYGDVLTIYSGDDVAMLTKYGDAAKNGVAILTQAFYEPKNTILRTQPDPSDNKVFTRVEHPPTFPGGEGAWSNYIRKHISDNIDALVSTSSTGTCRVRFIVDVDGTVSDVEALTMRGSKLAQVTVDAIKHGPNWLPARHNGHLVKSFAEQPVTFNVTN